MRTAAAPVSVFGTPSRENLRNRLGACARGLLCANGKGPSYETKPFRKLFAKVKLGNCRVSRQPQCSKARPFFDPCARDRAIRQLKESTQDRIVVEAFAANFAERTQIILFGRSTNSPRTSQSVAAKIAVWRRIQIRVSRKVPCRINRNCPAIDLYGDNRKLLPCVTGPPLRSLVWCSIAGILTPGA